VVVAALMVALAVLVIRVVVAAVPGMTSVITAVVVHPYPPSAN